MRCSSLRGAQGSSLEDIAVFGAPDTFAGFTALAGSGGAHSNLTVVGTRFGIDARESQPSPTLSNIRLYNQSCTSIIYTGIGALTLAGLHVVTDSARAEAGVAAIVAGGVRAPGPSSKGAKGAPESLPLTGHCAPVLGPATFGQGGGTGGALAIVDAVFECLGSACTASSSSPTRPAVFSSRHVYMRRVAVAGYGIAARTIVPNHTHWTHDPLDWPVHRSLPTTASNNRLLVNELSFAPSYGYNNGMKMNTINSTQWVDGKVATDQEITRSEPLPTDADLAADALCTSHSWGDNAAFPSHASPRAVSVTSFGAVGDGVHDDTATLQRAIDSAAHLGNVVFIPRGVYRTSRTVVVPPKVRLSGVARHLTGIVASDGVGAQQQFVSHYGHHSNEPDYDDTPPILAFSDTGASGAARSKERSAMATPETVLFSLYLLVPLDNVHRNTTMLSWQTGVSATGGFNTMRQFWVTSVPVCGQWFSTACNERFLAVQPKTSACVRIEGEHATARVFVFFQEDGGMNDKGRSESAFSRKLVVNGTRNEVAFYELNGEHGSTSAYSEFVNTSGVRVYGCKSEGGTAILFVRASTNFASYAHSGLASANAFYPVPAKNCDGLSPCPWGDTLYRIVNSTDVRLVNVMEMYSPSNTSGLVFELAPDGSNRSCVGDFPAVWFSSPQP